MQINIIDTGFDKNKEKAAPVAPVSKIVREEPKKPAAEEYNPWDSFDYAIRTGKSARKK